MIEVVCHQGVTFYLLKLKVSHSLKLLIQKIFLSNQITFLSFVSFKLEEVKVFDLFI